MKTFLAILTLAASLFLSAPAKAQYTQDPNAPCNSTLNGGFHDKNGSGSNGALVVRFYIQFHYTPTNLEGVKKDLAGVMVSEMNFYAKQHNYPTRIEATDYDNPVNSNFLVYLDVYSSDNNNDDYQVFISVSGWGAGHLFRFAADRGTLEDTLMGAANGTIARLNNGWTCGS